MIRTSPFARSHPTSQAARPARPARRMAAAVLAGLAALSTMSIATADAAVRPLASRISIPANSFTQLRPLPRIKKKALLVMMENGGFSQGLPEQVTFEYLRCATFRLPQGQDLGTFISSIASSLAGALQCLNPANWRTEQLNVKELIEDVTDQAIEDVAAGMILNSGVSQKYDRVVILQDGDFTLARVRQELAALAPTHIVDIHSLSHGSPNELSNPGTNITAQHIRDFANIAGLQLRAVYQQNCFGSTLNDDWLAAGAQTVNGSTLINHMPLSYTTFLSRWVAGQTFQQAVQGSTSDWTPFFTTVYRHLDLYSGNTPRQPAIVDFFGGLSPNEELSESAMIVQGATGTRV